MREMAKMKIAWHGSAVSCMETFKQLNCSLCMKERLTILKMLKKDPKKLVNSRSEICGACRHRTKFHRHHMDGNAGTLACADT